MLLEDKVAIVTGAAGGIGGATAARFAAEGATVYGADVRDLPADLAGVNPLRLDVTSLEAWEQAIDEVSGRHGRLDVLVNNAGTVRSYDGVVEISLENWNAVIALNQTAVFYGMRTAIPKMIESGGGSVVNLSSIWGLVGVAGVSAYQASKGAVHLMSKNAAMTYVDHGIRVNSIHPGIIATPMVAAQDADLTAIVVDATPMKRLGEPGEIAAGAVFLASDQSSFMTGAELVIDGGYTAQ